jgi:adenylate cyclase
MQDSYMLEKVWVHDLIDWILRQATAHDDLGALLTGTCERLVAEGIPIWRASLDLPTIDPNSRALMHAWPGDPPLAPGA